VAYSTDGITWTTVYIPVEFFFFGIAYGNGRFVAVGSGGMTAWSTDGQTWTAATHPFGTSDIYGITYGGGRFVAVGSGGGKMAYSNILE
jgi:hypothetical protein